MFIEQGTSPTIMLGPFLDSTDGATAETGLTISQADVRLSKNGGAYAQKNESSSATHDENGYYTCPLNATDTNAVGILKVAVSESGALPVWHSYVVLPSMVYDSLIGGTDTLNVDMVAISGDTTAADNLEEYCDGTTPQPVNTTEIEGTDATNQIGDAVWDEILEAALTARYMMRIALAALANESSGGGTTNIKFRDVADSKDRIDATVDTATGNRTAVSLDGS